MRYTLVAIILTAILPYTTSAQNFDLDWYTVDGGGATTSVGGVFELAGTIGQPDAGSPAAPLFGGNFELIGGFWSGVAACGCGGDVNGDCVVELTDLSLMLIAFGCCDSDACFSTDADVDGDGCVGLPDLAHLLTVFGSPCP